MKILELNTYELPLIFASVLVCIVLLIIFSRYLLKRKQMTYLQSKEDLDIQLESNYVKKYRDFDVLHSGSERWMLSLGISIFLIVTTINLTVHEQAIDHDGVYEVMELAELEVLPPRSAPEKKFTPPPPPPELELVEDDMDIEDPVFVDEDIDSETFIDEPQESEVVASPPPPPPVALPVTEEKEPPIHTIVEQMPRFPGCEDMLGSNKEKEACAKQQLLAYIYRNVKYPTIAIENGVEGMAVVKFVINESGQVDDIQLLRDPGAGTGKAAVNVISKMNDEVRWNPGLQGGRKVKVYFTLPIRFKLK